VIDDPKNQPAKPEFRFAGVGHAITRMCMGCNLGKSMTGGAGGPDPIRWRCAGCVAKRAARQAEKEAA
jgi:hypothetical protein